MLEPVDIAIAFTVLILSLFYTGLVRRFNSLLDMRGRSLAWERQSGCIKLIPLCVNLNSGLLT
jgi:hypothetical protein